MSLRTSFSGVGDGVTSSSSGSVVLSASIVCRRRTTGHSPGFILPQKLSPENSYPGTLRLDTPEMGFLASHVARSCAHRAQKTPALTSPQSDAAVSTSSFSPLFSSFSGLSSSLLRPGISCGSSRRLGGKSARGAAHTQTKIAACRLDGSGISQVRSSEVHQSKCS